MCRAGSCVTEDYLPRNTPTPAAPANVEERVIFRVVASSGNSIGSNDGRTLWITTWKRDNAFILHLYGIVKKNIGLIYIVIIRRRGL